MNITASVENYKRNLKQKITDKILFMRCNRPHYGLNILQFKRCIKTRLLNAVRIWHKIFLQFSKWYIFSNYNTRSWYLFQYKYYVNHFVNYIFKIWTYFESCFNHEINLKLVYFFRFCIMINSLFPSFTNGIFDFQAKFILQPFSITNVL